MVCLVLRDLEVTEDLLDHRGSLGSLDHQDLEDLRERWETLDHLVNKERWVKLVEEDQG